ncbi:MULTISPECIES: extracellular solute-binding protein [unclassified Paenibacillus]|uniref:extracellular solute-binding protein n=1 Tax=unclassified Paenibacillus TaxID=185978 RepID=UPI002785E926|nr:MULTISPECIES: extracellular solute-binding protein [unclassified Paenibacillus]MDQ0896783.1 putative aldouronate transport system substrate-binding protein [Paenibacillus sp. V4I7]MDQ0917108.1 putative aldouronate transport system substrate-binding protein [Paenibacillus sp. V4I5]
MKKTISLTLAVMLTASALTACSSDGKVAGNASPQPSDNVKKAPVKFSMLYPTTVSTGYHTRVPDLNKDKWILKLEELTNTDLDVKVVEDAKFGVMFASNDIPDVVGSIGGPGSKSMSGSVENGVFMPLDELLKQNGPNLLKAVPKAAWDSVSYEGKIYAVPEFLSNPSRRSTYIRTDLLEKAGLQAPKTVDEFLNVLRAFKKMGVENPYQMRENFKYADVILGAFDVLPYKDQFELVNGQVVPKFFDVENVQKALTTYKMMYDEGLIPKEFATITSTDFTKSIESGKAGIWSQNASGLPGYRTKAQQAVPGAKIDIIASPKGPEGKGGYFYYAPVIRSFFINKNVKPETAAGIIKMFDWMVSPEAETFFTFGVEGDTYTKDSSGKITYKFPTTKEETDEEGFRSGTMWAVHDSTYNKPRLLLNEDGKATLKAFDEVLSKEGLSGIGFYPDLSSFAKFPDLAAPQPDVGPKIIIDHMIKMIYGKEPISDWPKVIEEYKAKGGNEIIKEATDRWNKKQGAIMLDINK